MVYLISWRGRGLVGLFAALLVPAGLGVASLVDENAMALGISLGFISAGLTCAILGLRWNRANDIHRLGPFRLQTWGYAYLTLGLLLLPAAIGFIRMSTSARQPVTPVHRIP